MENNRFELQENDFEVIEAACAKCVYNCGALFGCEKYERIPATIRIGEERCEYKLVKADFISKHFNAIIKRLNDKDILISYPMLTLINDNMYYLYLILLSDGTVFGKVALDETSAVFKLKEFSEKRSVKDFDKEKYVAVFSNGIDLYAAMLENQKSNLYNKTFSVGNLTDNKDERYRIIEMLYKDMADIIHILKRINPVFFETLDR